jgi:hypothetical protein
MKRFKSKKAIVLLAALAVVAIAAVGAYAYFSNAGSGAGSASVGASAGPTLNATTVGAVTPGGQTGDVTITAVNNGTGHQEIGTVTLTSVDAFAGPGFTNPIPVGVGPGKCDTSKFSMAPVVENQDIAPGGPTALTVHGTLVMANDPSNSQDACQNAVLRLNLSSS